MNKVSYFDLIKDFTNKASNLHLKYQKYINEPEKLKETDSNLFHIFQAGESIFKIAEDYLKNQNKKNDNTDNAYSNIGIDKCYEILECNKMDSDERIKANYKKLVKEYHPDTIAGKDLPKGFVDFAHHRFKEIHSAYEILKKERRFK